VVLAVHQPRVVLVRRFMNNVLYVLGLVSHEVDAAGRVQAAAAAAQGRAQRRPVAPTTAVQASTDSPAVLLLTLTGVQVRWSAGLARMCVHVCACADCDQGCHVARMHTDTRRRRRLCR
jgi:hypothetical protein